MYQVLDVHDDSFMRKVLKDLKQRIMKENVLLNAFEQRNLENRYGQHQHVFNPVYKVLVGEMYSMTVCRVALVSVMVLEVLFILKANILISDTNQ